MPNHSFTLVAKSTYLIVSMCKVSISNSKYFGFVEDTYVHLSKNLAIFLKEIGQSEKHLTCGHWRKGQNSIH